MAFYIVRALFPALFIDIWLTIIFFKKNRNILSAFATAPVYLISTLIWSFILNLTNSAFHGQGVVGLMLLMFIGIAFSILRMVFGLFLILLYR